MKFFTGKSERLPLGFWGRWLAWWLGIAVVWWVARYQVDIDSVSLIVASRGYLSDLAMAWVLAGVLAIIPSLTVVSLFVFFIGWMIVGNAEHIDVNVSHAQATMWSYAADEGFIEGSLLTIKSFKVALLYWLIVITVKGLCGFVIARCRVPVGSSSVIGAWLISLIVLALYPLDKDYSDWVQVSIAEDNLHTFYEMGGTQEVPSILRDDISKTMAPFYQSNLLGKRRTAFYGGKKPNVLMVMVESLSQVHVEKGWMPQLKKMQEKGLHYKQFITPSAVTLNGIYALHCGDYPHLNIKKFATVERLGEKNKKMQRLCLPRLLKESGYHTLYMQGASLGFARKHKLLKYMGFEEMLGLGQLREGNDVRGWGLADNSLYDETFNRIYRLSTQQTPWFVSTLNLGTHHPYSAPKNFMPDMKSAQRRAYLYADQQLAKFIRRLDSAGFLENTIVIVTTDEVRPLGRLAKKYNDDLETNYGYLWIRLPSGEKGKIEEPFLQNDLLISLADLMGLDTANMYGRSVFRKYPMARNYFFASFHRRKLLIKTADNMLTICDRNQRCMKSWLKEENLFDNRKIENQHPTSSDLVRQIIYYNEQESH